MKPPSMGNFVDERFLAHRQRSTSAAAMAGMLVAAGIFFYRLIALDRIDWPTFAIILTVALVKIAMLLWYRATD